MGISPHRIGSDELTYNLHIPIRVNADRMLLDGPADGVAQAVANYPQFWSAQSQQYLGYQPKSDREGPLQDVHQANSLMCYSPGYTYGNVVAAQWNEQINRDLPDPQQRIASQGDLKTISRWLGDNLLRHGEIYSPDQHLQRVTGHDRVTGHGFDPSAFVRYAETKYRDICGL